LPTFLQPAAASRWCPTSSRPRPVPRRVLREVRREAASARARVSKRLASMAAPIS
jgi:hypothetical protein